MSKTTSKNQNNLKQIFYFAGAVVLLFLGLLLWKTTQGTEITNFEECVKAGYPIRVENQGQCVTSDGNFFAKRIKEQSEPISVTGQFVCLPQKYQTGPQTTECAFGLKTEDETYYALRDSDPKYKNLHYQIEDTLAIVGKFTPQRNSTYRDIGVIEIGWSKKVQ